MNKFIVCVFMVFTACASMEGVFLRETPLNISETRKAIVAIIGDPQSTSANGREIVSKPHDKNLLPLSDDTRLRYVSKFIILGDRRPYDIQVIVNREIMNDNFEFEKVGEDESLANRLADRLTKQLNQSRNNRNIIDDFRSF